MLNSLVCKCHQLQALDSAFELDQDKDATIRKKEPEAMFKKYVAMIHVVVLLQISLSPSLCGVHG
jgi:hypothetical protein